MHARVALLSLFLAGPALAAPVMSSKPAEVALSPDADNATILAVISAGDPALTASPSSVARVLEAVELAEQRLVRTADVDATGELLTLVGIGREVAYLRTGAAEHLCVLIGAAGEVLRRPGLLGTLAMEAADFRSRARELLAAKHPGMACDAAKRPQPERQATPPERLARQEIGKHESATPRVSAGVIAGGVLLGVAGLLGGALAGVRAYRGQASDRLDAILGDVRTAGGKTTGQAARIDELRGVEARTNAATVGLGVSIGVAAALGVSLAVWGSRRAGSSQRARVSPFGGPHGAGVMLGGHF